MKTALPSETELPSWWHDAVQLRRDIHKHPELRFEEHRTANLLAEKLLALGFDLKTEVAGTGVVATMTRGRGAGVLLRADMDALPITEIGDREYRSQTDGVMHACGHDVHMAVVMSAAALLSGNDDWSGTLTVVMQPAEEIPYGEGSGARAVIDSGVLDLTDTIVLGLHCWPWLKVGAIGIDPSEAMASKDAFQIVMNGSSTHAASPVDGRDALLAMTDLVSTLHGLVFRRIAPSDKVAFNVGTLDAQFGQSIMADRAEAIGTIRTLDNTVRERIIDTIEMATLGIASAHGCEASVAWANQMPAVRNAPELVAAASALLPELEGIDVMSLQEPPMTTDDFALYAEQAPSLYIKLGTGNDETVTPLHSTAFDVDERCIWVGTSALTRIAEHSLRSPSARASG